LEREETVMRDMVSDAKYVTRNLVIARRIIKQMSCVRLRKSFGKRTDLGASRQTSEVFDS